MSDRTRRRRTIAAVTGAALAAGALAAYVRARRRHAVATLAGDMPYLRFGSGQAPLIVMWGGPGNNLPSGFVPFLKRAWRALLQDYTICQPGHRFAKLRPLP